MGIGRLNEQYYKDYTAALEKTLSPARIGRTMPETQGPELLKEEQAVQQEKSPEQKKALPAGTEMDLNALSESLGNIRDFALIGKDSDLNLLDMDAAVSAMKKDAILQEYQYFVNSADNQEKG